MYIYNIYIYMYMYISYFKLIHAFLDLMKIIFDCNSVKI